MQKFDLVGAPEPLPLMASRQDYADLAISATAVVAIGALVGWQWGVLWGLLTLALICTGWRMVRYVMANNK